MIGGAAGAALLPRNKTEPLGDEGGTLAVLQLDRVRRSDQEVTVLTLLYLLEHDAVAKARADRDGSDETHSVQSIVQIVADRSGPMLETERPTEVAQHGENLKSEEDRRL